MSKDRPKEHTVFSGLSSDIERLIKDFFVDDPGGLASRGVWSPPTDVFEDETSLVLRMEIPGVAPTDFDVSVIDDRLVVRGRRARRIESDCRPCFLQVEIHHGAFVRVIPLRPGYDPDRIEAAYRDGFMEVRVARRGAALPPGPRRLDVGSEDPS
jgi:HSP20 family protein